MKPSNPKGKPTHGGLENFSRKIFPTVGLLYTERGTFAEIFLEKFSTPQDASSETT